MCVIVLCLIILVKMENFQILCQSPIYKEIRIIAFAKWNQFFLKSSVNASTKLLDIAQDYLVIHIKWRIQ